MSTFTFTKPTTTRAMRKNKQKASRRAREREHWKAWSEDWYFNRDRLRLTFRIWSGKDAHTLDSAPDWRPTRWVDVAKGKRATIPDFVMKANIYNLKKILRCLSMKDISFDIYNDVIEWSHQKYDERKRQQENQEYEKLRYLEYLDWDEPQVRHHR